jgi:hypothetical protein
MGSALSSAGCAVGKSVSEILGSFFQINSEKRPGGEAVLFRPGSL